MSVGDHANQCKQYQYCCNLSLFSMLSSSRIKEKEGLYAPPAVILIFLINAEFILDQNIANL